jgi:uncharacterized glyoxalase superfamily protein PhnB
MANVKPIPEGYGTVTPHIVVKDGKRAIDFYKKAFGAEERCSFPGSDGKSFMHGEIKIGNSIVMLAGENPQWNATSPATLGGSSVTLALYVTDCDKSFKRAIDAGAKPVMPPADMFWGDRFSVVTDPDGHKWSIATHVKDPSPAEMQTAMKAMCSG